MARDHGRVLCKIWQDKDFRALPRTAQALYIQLLSQPNVNNAGVLPLMASKWAKGCDQVTIADIHADVQVLVDAGFLVVDTDTEEVLIRSFLRNDGGMKHRYILKNALKMAEATESDAIRRVLAAELRRIRNPDAAATAAILDPPHPEPEPVPQPSEPHPNRPVIPPETHSEPTVIGSESEMAFETHSGHCGEGEGEGVGDRSVVGHHTIGGGPHACDAREAQTPRGRKVDPDGWRLVREIIPAEHPHPTRTDLAIRAAALLKSGTPEPDVRAALGLWLDKPHLGPGALASLVSEVVRLRSRPAATTGAASSKAGGWLDVGAHFDAHPGPCGGANPAALHSHSFEQKAVSA
ncbi:hypothetical protein [Nocardia terpenica]|uniref:Uncharacterized protein n=1 Tax=Nocardia terpenica TaxID=455432 RepID=A0A164H9U6_9NOCA|nr:hypothetical protein [Nocardia terpenica]KZM68325.1 hypothetical protein AWN90_10565 [Nocardia terpenica]NQE88767.1 hypothetical protein [Nocardia terpenica]